MLEKMGWEGGGLGRSKDGIQEPIQVQQRANKSGLGTDIPVEASNKYIHQIHWHYHYSFYSIMQGCVFLWESPPTPFYYYGVYRLFFVKNEWSFG